MVSAFVVLASVLALASAQDDSKSAAVNKVVDLLEDLTKKVKEEGMEEAKTYEQFACFCKDNIKEKQSSIQSGKDNKAKLSTAITDDSAKRDGLDDDIKDLVDKIDKKEKAIAKLKKDNKEAVEEYEVNAADLNNAIKGLKGAIGVMKINKAATPAFVQIPQDIMETINTAAVMADALGLASGKAVTALLQKPSLVAASSSVKKIEPYSFDGGDIIKTLEQLQTDFKKEKSTLDSTEKTRKDKFDKDLSAAETFVETKNTALEGKKDDKAKTTAQMATESKDLSGISAQLLDDMDYLKELAQICGDKAKTWDVRNKVRADELTALAAATGIVKGTVADKTSKGTVRLIQQKFSATRAEFMVRDEDAMEQAEADAEQQEDSGSFALGFLQKRSSPHFGTDGVGMATRELQRDLDHPERMAVQQHDAVDAPKDGRQAVMMLLKKAGVSLKSSMLTSLASQIAADPFAKIKKLIQELIERMLTEAANESSQKGWCDKSIADAEQKRDYTAEKLEALNTEMAKQEARRDTLVEELAELAKEIKDLTKAQKDADADRKKEKAENEVTVTEAKAGLGAVKQAIDILDKFYKTAAKSKVLVQVGGPKDDMPDAGFDNGEAYKGAQGGAGGVVGMLEVIDSDFVRTVKKTEEAEAQAEDDHLKFSTETQMSLAAKKQATTIKTEQKDDAKEKLSDAEDGMKAKTTLMTTTIKELLDLQPACVDTGMSCAERVEARENEVKALKKALCIFEAYQKYGADGAGAQC
jgi:chromosome segregation ATPase